jgi:hypothetical protein
MARETNGAPSDGAPREVQQPDQLAEHQQHPTVTDALWLRRRRAAARRLPPMDDGRQDPLDKLAGLPVLTVEWGGYDVTTLGLSCAHGDRCTARYRDAV